MSKIYGTNRCNHRVEVEADNSLFVVTRLRLLVDGFRADERSAMLGDVRLSGELRGDEEESPVSVEVSVGIFGDVTRCVLVDADAEYPLSEVGRPDPTTPASKERGKERELLEALHENDCRITATEAAMKTSLSVREAEQRLSELAGSGHLIVERAGDTLAYALPGEARPELGER